MSKPKTKKIEEIRAMSKAVDLSPDYRVSESNKLIEARYRLNLTEQKFVLVMASLVQPEDEDFRFYEVDINELGNILQLDDDKKWGSLYERIHDLVENLNKKTLRIYEEDQLVSMSWVASVVTYIGKSAKKGVVSFEFSERLKPYLLQLGREFKSYRLKNVLGLKSVHAIRIYRLMKQYEKAGRRRIDYLELKEILGIEDKYKYYRDFKKRVLEKARKEVETTDIRFEYEEIRKGRKVQAIEFTIHRQKGESETRTLIDVAKSMKEEPEMVTMMIKKGKLPAKEAWEIWEKGFDFVAPEHRVFLNEDELSFEQYLREKLFLVEKEASKGKLRNVKGFTYNAIHKNYTSLEFAEHEEKKAKAKKKDVIGEIEREKERIRAERDKAGQGVISEILAEDESLLETVIGEMMQKPESGLSAVYKVAKTPGENYQSPIIKGIIDQGIREKFSGRFEEIEGKFSDEIKEIEKRLEEAKAK